MNYVHRVVDSELDALLRELPAISLEGARGVGKTATAERRAATAFYLDDPAQRTLAEAGPGELLSNETPILIDEWQRVPAVWDAVRRAVDRGARPGSFILTGSATPSDAPTHSGAGRIATLQMRPMSLAERQIGEPTVSLSELLSGKQSDLKGHSACSLANYVDEIVRTGFPGIRSLSDRALRRQLDGYLSRIIEADFQEQGHPVRRPSILSAWLRAYGAATATTASLETIRDAATGGQGDKPARKTTEPYRDVLSRLWILDPLQPWIPSRNTLNRLTHSPKHHLVDPGIAVRLLGVDGTALLSGDEAGDLIAERGDLLGNLFESLVAQSVRAYAPAAEANVYHLQLHGGRHEVDLIVERGDGKVVAIEVKLGGSVGDGDVAHLTWLRDQIGSNLLDAIVINTGPAAYRRPDGIGVVPGTLLGP